MTAAQQRALGAYVREIADTLSLVEWKLVLIHDRPDGAGPGTSGHCHVTFGHTHARIWIEPTAPEERPDWVRYVVTHELLHIPLQAPWWAWSRPVEDLVGVSTYDAICANAITAWEDTVDRLARVIGPMLPHCDWTADPAADWIAEPDTDRELVLYSRMYHEAGHERPLS